MVIRAPRKRWAASILAVMLALASACQSQRCEKMSLCDIRSEACQREAMAQARCLRARNDDVAVGVDVVTVNADEYLKTAMQHATAAESDEDRWFHRGLSLVGLAPTNGSAAGQVKSHIDLVAAFYDSEENRVTVLDRGQSLKSIDYSALLVHEMVHALQDAAGELSKQDAAESWDSWLAVRAMTEGEATLFEDETIVTGLGYSIEDIDYEHALAVYRRKTLTSASESDDLFGQLGMLFPYAYGASYLWPLRKDGPSKIREAYARLPVSTFAVMQRDPRRAADRTDSLASDAVPVFKSLDLVGSARFGRFVFDGLMQAHDALAQTLSADFGKHFVADTLSVFLAAETDEVLVAWRFRFDSALAAQQLEAALPEQFEDVLTASEGADAWLILAESSRLLESVTSRPSWTKQTKPDYGFAKAVANGRLACARHAMEAL